MKTRIEIRGVITSARLDDPWFESFISKGMITPESRIRAAIAAAGPEIELYINSYGGDVLAGNEMIVALKTAMAAGKKVEIVVGAMAFSMAANMIVMLPGAAKISAFSNSRIGYHGAYTCSCGGEGAHKDSAEMLAGINAQVISAIKSKGLYPPSSRMFQSPYLHRHRRRVCRSLHGQHIPIAPQSAASPSPCRSC